MKIKIREDMTEEEKIHVLTKAFHEVMKNRMKEKIAENWGGWEDKSTMKENLLERILSNLMEGDWVDVANLSMLAWNLNLKPKECF